MITDEPLYPHLLEILAQPAARYLILAGGFGIRLKRGYMADLVRDGRARTLLADFPEARATSDLDFFLRLEAFVNGEGAEDVRSMLDALRYTVREGREHWQFARPLGSGHEGAEILFDLLARPPEPEEGEQVRFDVRRVRRRGQHIALHGRTTPEAFPVEDSVFQLPLAARRDDGSTLYVPLPHAYSWICMKTVAGHDWLQGRERARPASEKHAFDVYLLVAMLTEDELRQCVAMHRRYADHDELSGIRLGATELFGTADSPGFLQARRIAGRELDFETFRQAYHQVLGIAGA